MNFEDAALGAKDTTTADAHVQANAEAFRRDLPPEWQGGSAKCLPTGDELFTSAPKLENMISEELKMPSGHILTLSQQLRDGKGPDWSLKAPDGAEMANSREPEIREGYVQKLDEQFYDGSALHIYPNRWTIDFKNGDDINIVKDAAPTGVGGLDVSIHRNDNKNAEFHINS